MILFPPEFTMPALIILGVVILALLVFHFSVANKLKRIISHQRELIIRMEADADASDRYGETFKNAARASVMAVGQELSSKLLEDHKREAKAVKQELDESAEGQQQKFLKQFGELSNSVAAISEVSRQTQDKADTLWRTMASPSTAGQLTEVSLENLLLNLGLKRQIDFELQAHIQSDSGSQFRPDAIVYLPHDRLMIIDSKASKFELELASAKTKPDQDKATEQFRKSMHQHLDALSRKNYTASVMEDYKRKNGRVAHPHIINVMYIASDAAVSRLDQIDPSFREKMQKYHIIAVGPAGLHGLCTIASMQIAELKRDENREILIKEMERVLAGLAINLDHLDKTGTHLKRAAESYSRFAASYNSTLAPRLRKMGGLGVKAEGKKQLPNRLAAYEMHEVGNYIDADSEENGHSKGDISNLSDLRKEAS